MRLTRAQFKEILSDKMTEVNGVSRLLALMVRSFICINPSTV